MDMRAATLTAHDIRVMRENFAIFAGRRAKSDQWIKIEGGPLDGMSLPDPNPRLPIIGWCQVTARGCVQAFYDLRPDGRLHFREQLLMA